MDSAPIKIKEIANLHGIDKIMEINLSKGTPSDKIPVSNNSHFVITKYSGGKFRFVFSVATGETKSNMFAADESIGKPIEIPKGYTFLHFELVGESDAVFNCSLIS